MPQINLAGGPHGTTTTGAGTADETRYWPYPKGTSLSSLQRAFFIISHNIFKKNVACNRYFRHLSGARSFDDVWNDATIWVNYEPRVGLGWDGSTNAVGGKEITIGEEAFQKGNVWYVVAVLVHELAHTNGAGGPPSQAAANALKSCGLAALYDGAVGVTPGAARDTNERVV
jgi:hypothetical protein